MNHFANVILLILVLTSCQNDENYKQIAKTEQDEQISMPYSSLILYDDFDNELILDTVSVQREAQFSPIYIGEIKDSIKLIYKTSEIEQRTHDWFKYEIAEKTDLEIFIDTSKTIGFPMDVWEYYKAPEHRVNKKSYPIFIKNRTSDTLRIGCGDIIPMVTESQDSLGNWNQMEQPFIYFCGTGLSEFFLPPNQIMISSLRQNFGKSNTKFRVRLELRQSKIYSNAIKGKINH